MKVFRGKTLEKWTAIKEQSKIHELRNTTLFSVMTEIWKVNLLFLDLHQYSLSRLSSTLISGDMWLCSTAGTSRATLMLPSGIHMPYLRRTEKTGLYSENVFPISEHRLHNQSFCTTALELIAVQDKWLEGPFSWPSTSPKLWSIPGNSQAMQWLLLGLHNW